MKVKVVVILLMLQVFCSAVYAQDYNPLKKMVRGMTNVSWAISEVPRQMIYVTKEEGDLAGATWGIAKGFAYMFGRMFVGAYEVATFLAPPYRPVVRPEFIFTEEDE